MRERPGGNVCAIVAASNARRVRRLRKSFRWDLGSLSSPLCSLVAPIPGGVHTDCLSPSANTGGNGKRKRPRPFSFCARRGGLSMNPRSEGDARSDGITALLRAWSGGDEAALSRLAEQVYPELHRIARRY